MSRVVFDRRFSRHGCLDGSAQFTRRADGLDYYETGLLRFPGQTALRADRRYRWEPDARGAKVFFEDGRFFHALDFVDDWRADHDCAPDHYSVRFDFKAWPDWTAEWTVLGPEKDYVMQSRFSPEA